MTRINLLPWREKKRAQAKKLFTLMIALCALSGFFIVFAVNYYVSKSVEKQTIRNQLIQKEINSQEEQIKKIDKIKKALVTSMSIGQTS